MKKILFYINILELGGAERVMTNLANRFSQGEYEVILVTSYAAEKSYETYSGVKRVVLSGEQLSGRLKKNFYLTHSLRKLIKREQPNVVISFMAEPNFRAILATMFLKNVKTIVSVRNDPAKEYSGKLLDHLAKMFFSFADGIVVQTKDVMEWLPSKLRNKAIVLRNQVADIFFETQGRDDRHGIFTVGRLEKQKNHAMLIRAFEKIKDETDENLFILGEGSLRGELEQQIEALKLKDRVFLCGTVSNVNEKIANAALFVLPSDYEGLPNALMEAMAEGLLCVSTDCPCGGPRELIREGDNGFLIPVGDEDAMAQAISEIFRMEQSQREHIRMAGKETANEFRGTRVFKKWEQFILQVIQGDFRND